MNDNNKFQLFKKLPTKEYVTKIMNMFGIKDYEENIYYTREQFYKNNIIDNLNNEKELLLNYYFDCKSKIYLNFNNVKKCITVLRQLLKIYDYKLKSKEKYINKRKILVYYIKSINISNKIETTLSFD